MHARIRKPETSDPHCRAAGLTHQAVHHRAHGHVHHELHPRARPHRTQVMRGLPHRAVHRPLRALKERFVAAA